MFSIIIPKIRMNLFVSVSRLVIFALSVETGIAANSSFLPDTFTFWFWQSCKHLSLPQVDATKNKFAALVVNNWLYIDGGDIYAKWYGLNTNSSMVFSASFP